MGVHKTLQVSLWKEGWVKHSEGTQSLSQHLQTRKGAGRQGIHTPGVSLGPYHIPQVPVLTPLQGLGPLASPHLKTETILEPPAFCRRVQVLHLTLQCLEKRCAFGRGFVESGGAGDCSRDCAPPPEVGSTASIPPAHPDRTGLNPNGGHASGTG